LPLSVRAPYLQENAMTSHRIATTREKPTLGDFKSGDAETRPLPRKPAARPLRAPAGHRGPRALGPVALVVPDAAPSAEVAPALPANENAAESERSVAESVSVSASPYREVIERTRGSQAYANLVSRGLKPLGR
jgi:hypothetical protein